MLVGISGLYYPSYFLLERGNVDGLAMLCVGLVIWAPGRTMAAALMVLGASIKIYPAALTVWFVAQRQWRSLLIGVLAAVVSLAAVWPFWSASAQFIGHRVAYFRVDENVSVLNFVLVLARICHLSRVEGIALGIVIIAGFLGIHAVADARQTAGIIMPQQAAARVALYIPFFAAAPTVVYPYTQVCFLLLLPVFLWMSQTGIASPRARFYFTVGFLFTSVQAAGLDELYRACWFSRNSVNRNAPSADCLRCGQMAMGLSTPPFRGELL